MALVRPMQTGLAVILLASLVASTSLVAAAQSETAAVSDIATASPSSERVLFIGNSHTYINGGVEWHIGRMAAAEDPPRPFVGDSEIISGATLEEHYQRDSQGRIPEGDYDVVVLQGHIPRSADPSAAPFLEYARLFDSVAREYGARTVFFMTWPHIDFRDVKLRDIVKAHRRISAELGAEVAPVAVAMQRVRKERPRLEMLSDDGVHASWAGSYLASAVLYANKKDNG